MHEVYANRKQAGSRCTRPVPLTSFRAPVRGGVSGSESRVVSVVTDKMNAWLIWVVGCWRHTRAWSVGVPGVVVGFRWLRFSGVGSE